MRNRVSRTASVLVVAPILALTVLAACEDSSTGASVARPVTDASTDGFTRETSTPPGQDSGKIALSSCFECFASECTQELNECGLECGNAITCFSECGNSIDCQDRCLRNVNDFKGHIFFGCFTACGDPTEPEKCNLAFQRLLETTKYGLAFCQKFLACNPGSLVFNYGSLETCVASVGQYFLWESKLTDSRISLVEMTACETNVAQISCEDFNSARLNAHCITRGTRLIDEACLDDAQCETSFCTTNTSTCSKCALPPAVGKPCIEGRCGPGLTCADDGKVGLCVIPSHYGDPCDAAHPCEGSSFCKGGFCQSKSQTAGEACGTGGTVCDGQNGFTCDGTNKCVRYRVSAGGGFCGTDAQGPVFCLRSAKCVSNVCDAPPEIDEPCDDETGPTCLFPAQCIDGKCRDLPVSGTDCQ